MADDGLQLPAGKQLHSYVDSNARMNLWHGAVRSGKTVGSIFRWVQHVVDGPPGELVMVGKTHDTIHRNVLLPLQGFLGSSACHISMGQREVRIFGRRVFLAGANDTRAEEKIRGMTLAGAYGDEVTVWPESMLAQLDARCSVAGAKLFLTTNPDSPNHWLKKNYLDREEYLGADTFRSFHFGLEDNPFLDPSYVDILKRTYTGLWYRRMILGEWAVAEGAVYPMWNPDTMVYRGEAPDLAAYYLGVDAGFTHPMAAVLAGIGPKPGLWVPGEFRQAGLTDVGVSRKLAAWLLSQGLTPDHLVATHVDPSAPSLREQLYQDQWPGLGKAQNDVATGIRQVASLMSLGLLNIHEGAEGLITELASYRWDAKAQARGEDKPVKEQDDSVDALRYAVMSSRMDWRDWVRADPST